MNNYAPKNMMPVTLITLNYVSSTGGTVTESLGVVKHSANPDNPNLAYEDFGTIEDNVAIAETQHFPEANQVIEYIRNL
jgi:hypothetical protein